MFSSGKAYFNFKTYKKQANRNIYPGKDSQQQECFANVSSMKLNTHSQVIYTETRCCFTVFFMFIRIHTNKRRTGKSCCPQKY